jgi:hypothetical protein
MYTYFQMCVYVEQLLISERCRTAVHTTDSVQGFLDLNVSP